MTTRQGKPLSLLHIGAAVLSIGLSVPAGAQSLTDIWNVNRIFGGFYNGNVSALNLFASYAHQTDYGDNPNSYAADYFIVEGSGKVGSLNLLLGYENLGSDNGNLAFSTPLATLHRYQGFADSFLNTPANGIEDIYLSASTTLNALNLSTSLHRYNASEGSQHHGNEWDVVAGYKFNVHNNWDTLGKANVLYRGIVGD